MCIRDRTMTKDADLTQIIAVVNSINDCNIREKSRVRNVVDAKRIYSSVAKAIFPKKTFKEIGAEIGVSHCTILYHLKDFKALVQQDKGLRDAHQYCLEICTNMLGKAHNNYLDKIILNWSNLTLKQKKMLGELAEEYITSNSIVETIETQEYAVV